MTSRVVGCGIKALRFSFGVIAIIVACNFGIGAGAFVR
jgi:hypothetical protein